MRKKFQTTTTQIEDLVENFGESKEELTKLKATVDNQSAEIKKFMTDNNLTTISSKNYRTLLYTYQKQSMDEEKLLIVLKKHNLITGVIKTREYVDMDALETILYNSDVTMYNDVLSDIDSCRITKDVTSIRVNKIKETV